MNRPLHSAFMVLSAIVVAAAIGCGFYFAGSPVERRLERFDQQRLNDLQTIAREIQDLCIEETGGKRSLAEALPATLDDLAARARNQRITRFDPQTGTAYEYTVVDDHTFTLCAEFALPRDADQSVFWNHPAGRHCFTIDVLDPPRFY